MKPATIPGAAAAPAPAKAAAKPASGQNNTLQRVNVVHNADDIQIEISSREAVTPKVSKLSSPARVVVELPATVMATPQSKIAVGSAGVKGVRIGMDGKTPPTTSVVVDLEQALGYELTPGPGNSFVLTLHTQAVAKSLLRQRSSCRRWRPKPGACSGDAGGEEHPGSGDCGCETARCIRTQETSGISSGSSGQG